MLTLIQPWTATRGIGVLSSQPSRVSDESIIARLRWLVQQHNPRCKAKTLEEFMTAYEAVLRHTK